jgi:hypothetical protein
MPSSDRRICDSERLCARFDDHPTSRSARQHGSEAARLAPNLLNDLTSTVAHAYLTLSTADIDSDVVHDQPQKSCASLRSVAQILDGLIERGHFIPSDQAHRLVWSLEETHVRT